MKRSYILACVIAGVLPQIAAATTVTWGAVPTARTVTLEDGLTTVTSGLVLIGTFASTGFTFDSNLSIATNFANIMANGGWKQFTLDTTTGLVDGPIGVTNTMTITGTGKVGGQVTDNNNGPVTPTKADFFNGKGIYMWLFNGSTPAASSQMGIFTATTASPVWTFPNNLGGVGDNTPLGTSASLAATMVAVGGTGSGATAGQLRLVAAVPEPSVLALGGMAAVGMLASRKRRQRK